MALLSTRILIELDQGIVRSVHASNDLGNLSVEVLDRTPFDIRSDEQEYLQERAEYLLFEGEPLDFENWQYEIPVVQINPAIFPFEVYP